MNKKFDKIHKLTDNPFLNLYQMDALDTKGMPFSYYFASRNDAQHIKIRTKSVRAEGIVIYAVTEEAQPRLVLIRQYRYPVDAFMYELPAGLIDGDETHGMAAAREMKEETGLDFIEYTGGRECYRRPYFMGPGFTDETSATVFGTVSGTVSDAFAEDTEEIQVILADKEKVRHILANERVSIRGAYLMMHFLHASEPFSFLDA
ncbi:MAG: NUDIX hydrolase [Eubacterium sp.]|jgi:NTP pyrophosphohydrolases including oxidative damage repair enzymes|nr:NUDIX hydrolase [Eubacterium sp.]